MPAKKNDKFLNNNKNLPINIEHDYTEEQIQELVKCREDVFHFAEKYFHIIHLDRGKETIKLYPAQANAIDTILKNRFTIICASRQVGKSTLMTVVCLWYAIFNPDYAIAILANKEDIAKEILERIKMAYEELPNWLKAGVEEFTKENLKLKNGSKIVVSTTSQDAIRGKSINLVFMDEFAHVRPEIAEPFFKSVMPTISSSTKSKMVIVSTPKGAEGKYYELYSNAEKLKNSNKKNKWNPIKIHYSEVPGRTEEWKMEQLMAINYDMNLWNQEFELHFLEQGSSAINGALIDKMKLGVKPPYMTFDDGDYSLWEEPVEGHIYVFGVDAAQGVQQDWTVAQIFDITDLKNIRQVAKFASNKISPSVFAEKLNQIARQWGRPFLCIESNKEGAQVLDALINHFYYENIVYYNMENDKSGYYQKPGIFCHQNSKYTGITNMKYWVEYLECVTIYDIITIKEFETFVRKENKTWAAKKGYNDDHVMALIWALILLETDIADRYLDVIEYDDVGKPMRIEDPNAELALQAFHDGGKKAISYAKMGDAPPPMIIKRGHFEMFPQKEEHESMFGDNFRIL